jgi:hypothetical protein
MLVLRIDEAYLVGAWSAAALWGIFGCLIVFALAQVYAQHLRGEVTRSTRITICAALVLYGLSTAHVSLSLRRLIDGLINIQGPESMAYFAKVSAPLNRAKNLVYVTSTVIADSIVVWRCWAIWNGNLYALALPILLVLGTAVSAYGASAQYFLKKTNPETALDFGTALFAVSLTTNVVVTLLTIGRIWWMSHTMRGNEQSGWLVYRRTIVLLFETGLVITIAKIFEFAFFKQITPGTKRDNFNGLYVVFDMMPQINGIIPTAIILVVLLRRKPTSTYAVRKPSQGSAPDTVVSKLVFENGTQTGTSTLHPAEHDSSQLHIKSLKFSYAETEEAMNEDRASR